MQDQEEIKKKKTICYSLTGERHDQLKELAFRETMARKDGKRVSQQDVVDQSILDYYNRRKRQWLGRV
jgi:hypothetical protein